MPAPTAARFAVLLRPYLGSGAAYAALAVGLRSLVLDGRLPVGTRLPSERELAAALTVSRTTVTAAYDVLRRDGYLRSARAAGSRVALPAPSPTRPDEEFGDRPDVLDLTVAALPAPALLLDAVGEAAVSMRPLLSGHGLHPLGLPELRAAVSDHLSARGLGTNPEQVLVTGGALHGWDLLLRALTKPGDRVLIEQPTYPAVLDAIAAHRLRPVALPVTEHGWDLPVQPVHVRLAHVTPDFQNPTGLLADRAQRRALLTAAKGAVVVADETFADLAHPGTPPVPPLAALGPGVVTLGSMSKAFWAGLRVGWLRADRTLVRRLAQLRAGQDLASPVLDQLVAARLLARAGEVLPDRRVLLARRRDAFAAALAHHLPGWHCAVPTGGMVLWPELGGASATRLSALAMDHGLRLTPGPRFTVAGTHDRWLRLPFTGPAESADAVAARLASLVSRLGEGRPAARPDRWTA